MESIRLMLDFGVVILIWIVQLVIYPSFLHFSIDGLKVWHRSYAKNISYLVAPLMLTQLGIHASLGYYQPGLLNHLTLLLILLNWGLTFGWAVPLHARIENGTEINYVSTKLVSMNKYRTFLWTLVFLITLFQSI